MCLNYKEGNCIVDSKPCKFGEKGKDMQKGGCDLHGDYDVWANGKIIITNDTIDAADKTPLGLGINFLTADELGYKKSKNRPIEYVFKDKKHEGNSAGH